MYGNKKKQVKRKSARESYADIAKKQGLYDEIINSLKEFIQISPFYGQKELMYHLINKFPTVFGNFNTKYPQNFYKTIMRVDDWSNALKVTEKMTRRAILNAYYKRATAGRREETDSNGYIYEIGMPDRDAMNFVRLLHDIEVWDDEDGTEKRLRDLKIQELENKNKLLEAQIAKLKGNDNDDAYIKGFIADLDQIDDE